MNYCNENSFMFHPDLLKAYIPSPSDHMLANHNPVRITSPYFQEIPVASYIGKGPSKPIIVIDEESTEEDVDSRNHVIAFRVKEEELKPTPIVAPVSLNQKKVRKFDGNGSIWKNIAKKRDLVKPSENIYTIVDDEEEDLEVSGLTPKKFMKVDNDKAKKVVKVEKKEKKEKPKKNTPAKKKNSKTKFVKENVEWYKQSDGKPNHIENSIPWFFGKFQTENIHKINQAFYFDPIKLSL